MTDGQNSVSGETEMASTLRPPSATREREPDPALFREVGAPQEEPQEQQVEEPEASADGPEPTLAEGENSKTKFSSVEEAERHFQSQKDKEVAKLKAEFDQRLEKLEAKQEMEKSQQAPPSADQSNPYSNIMADYQLEIPDSSLLAGEEDTLKQIVSNAIDHAIARVQGVSETQMQQAQLNDATQRVAAEAQNWTPEQQQGLVQLADQYQAALVRDPDAFVKFAKLQLGVQDAAPEPTPEPELPKVPTKIAHQATAASTRPSSGAGAQMAPRKFSTMREAIADAVRNH